jgi:DnaA-homolog protein
MNNLKQLALNLCLKDTTSFTNFFVGANKQLVKMLNDLSIKNGGHFIYCWGKHGAGKSHLLSALCQSFSDHGLITAYLPLEDAKKLNPKMLEDLEQLDLLCIDDLNLISDNLAWEEEIFHCFNKMMAHNKHIVITASMAPQSLNLKLSDLKSRMAGGLIFELQALNDIEKIECLKLRAELRGLELNNVVAQFLLHHYARDTKNLFTTLDRLDKAALLAQRKLTIPFVKSILGNS